ncbi:hypothetical protein QYE76_005203 [Lolium multiflorum]|jgi:hypothetical protein|uniref:F-box domain-containing protein n=1 Tax=Lolium multiflorum TaxID=4521 RepID=A0AAD8W2X3_LOLMU|nr:hypothetical protein QYE76_005203 [Lolium multiflorum]
MALPEDMLLEIFKRLQHTVDVTRCAAVCRRWRSVISACASSLPARPRHLGFFYNYACDQWFVPTKAGVDLSLGRRFVPPISYGTVVEDCRGGRLLLRKVSKTELRLIVCHPLERSFVRLPPLLAILADRLALIALVPTGPGFRVAVVVLDLPKDGWHFHLWVYHCTSDSWESAEFRGAKRVRGRARALVSTAGQSIVVGDIVYKLQRDHQGIVAINTAEMTLYVLPLPADAATNMYQGDRYCIGKTADCRLCFFTLVVPLVLLTWILQGPAGTWEAKQTPVALWQLMKLSVWDWYHRHVGFRGFCEGSGTLFFIMTDRLIALDLNTLNMEMMWDSTDKNPLRQVYPYEMLPWPPVLKDFTKSTVLGS